MTELTTREAEITTRDSLLDRTMQNLREAWRDVADSVSYTHLTLPTNREV